MNAHHPQALSAGYDPSFNALIEAAIQGQLVLYLGAGVSRSQPSDGPRGADVADALRPLAARWMGVAVETLAGLTLEALSESVLNADPDRLPQLRAAAAEAFPFRTISPNYGHCAAALLLQAGFVELISVNWDCGVERAGTDLRVMIGGVVDSAGSVDLGHQLRLYKVHGCATKPHTLALTTDEVDKPQQWAIARTQGALASGIVAFVGLGTVGLYVSEPFAELMTAWVGEATTVRLVDPVLARAWRKALGDEAAAEAHLARSSDEFFDELMRALVLRALDLVELAVGRLGGEDWAAPMVAGFNEVRQGFDDAHADACLRWWSEGFEGELGQRFVNEASGRHCLMTAALLVGADGGGVQVDGEGGRQTVATARRYIEIAGRPSQPIGRVQAAAIERIEDRRAAKVYADERPVTVILVDALGRPPAPGTPVDIAAGKEGAHDLLAGPEVFSVEFLTAEDWVSGRLAA